MYLIFYRTSKNRNIFRLSKGRPFYNIGDKTSMGWTLVSVQTYYKGGFVSNETKIKEEFRVHIKKVKIKNRLSKICKILDIFFT